MKCKSCMVICSLVMWTGKSQEEEKIMCECVEVKVFTPRAGQTENSAITYQLDSVSRLLFLKRFFHHLWCGRFVKL